jgi:hypothetical protein
MMDTFMIENTAKFNPLKQTRPMQEVLVAIQNSCAVATDDYKVCIRKAKERPPNLAQL